MGDNLSAYYKAMFEEAYRATVMSRFAEADDLCHQMLRDPVLPLLYRAGCNLFLSFGDDNPVGFAKEAVFWYEEMYNQVRDDPQDGPVHLRLLEQARDALTEAESRAAESDANADSDDQEQEDTEEDSDKAFGSEKVGEQGAGEESDSDQEVEEQEIAEHGSGEEIQESLTAEDMPSSSLAGRTVIGASSSQIATQVEDDTTSVGKKADSNDEDQEA